MKTMKENQGEMTVNFAAGIIGGTLGTLVIPNFI
jgi:hypothetical protein